MNLILPETCRSQMQYIQESPKFQLVSEELQPVPFPGYAIMTPPAIDEADNTALYAILERYQQHLVDELGNSAFAPVPGNSLHLTLADLIWDSAYRDASQNPDYDQQLQQQIAHIFERSQILEGSRAIQFQAIGLIVMTRAIAACLVPTDEVAYERLLKFRRAIYQNRDLMGLGIEQQYYFTPHITLGYFGEVPAPNFLGQCCETLVALNQQWLEEKRQDFWVRRAELRRFDDMTHYYRESDWATFDF
jgi:hypothetical protein